MITHRPWRVHGTPKGHTTRWQIEWERKETESSDFTGIEGGVS